MRYSLGSPGSRAVNDGMQLLDRTDAPIAEASQAEPLAVGSADDPPTAGWPNQPPRVSIVISNYNYERYVAAAVDSALAQTVPDCEVIVVDDGSSDHSRALLERYRDHPRVELIFQENGGQAVAMNVGFAASRGDIVIFLDSDDALKPETVERVLARWRPGLSRCQFALEVIDSEDRRLGLHPFSQTMEDGDVHGKLLLGGYFRFIPTSGNAFARAALTPILPMPVAEWRLCADTYLVAMSTAYGEVLNIAEPLGFYRVHEANNWYREVLDPEHLRVIWRQHFQVWRSLTRSNAIAPSTATDPQTRARDADMARLHVYRRILTGYMLEPDIVPPDQVKAVRREAMRASLGSSLTPTQKILYAAVFALIGNKSWRFPAARKWNAHHVLRPKKLRAVVEWLKGDDFYEWMKRRPLPAKIETFPVDQHIHFGKGRSGEAFLWHGWDRSDACLNWTVGREAALIGHLPNDCGDVNVALELAPYTANLFKQQRIIVSVNRCVLIERQLRGQQVLGFSLSRALAKRNQPLVIGITCPDCIAPNQIEKKRGDYRPLGFAVKSLKLTERGSASGATAGMYVPLGQTVAFSDPAAHAYLDATWHAPRNGVARMARRQASLRMSVVNGSADPHVLTLKLAGLKHPTLHHCGLRVGAAGKTFAVVDASIDREISLLLPAGAVAASGQLELNLAADNLLAMPAGEGVEAVGPGLVSFSVERLSGPTRRPAFIPGFVYGFAAGGTGLKFRQAGWYAADDNGSLSGEVSANVSGVFFTRQRYVFITAAVYPAFQMPEGMAQQVTIACGGTDVATYDVAQGAELTAIVPADRIGPDGVLGIEFRVSLLARPIDLGAGEEERPLGIGLALLRLD